MALHRHLGSARTVKLFWPSEPASVLADLVAVGEGLPQSCLKLEQRICRLGRQPEGIFLPAVLESVEGRRGNLERRQGFIFSCTSRVTGASNSGRRRKR